MNNEKKLIVFAICFPFFLHIIAYYGFESSYYQVKEELQLRDWYSKGIYGYRVLSRELVDILTIWCTGILNGDIPGKGYILTKGTPYYHALFLFNTLFAILTSFMLLEILSNDTLIGKIADTTRAGILFFMSSLMAFSQYVVLHYDNSAVFLLLLGFYFSLKYYRERRSVDFGLTCLLIFISTLNRETSCLNLAFLAALLFPKFSMLTSNIRSFVRLMLCPVIAFLLPYVVLRMLIPQEGNDEFYFFESITLLANFSGLNHIVGWLFGLFLLYFILFFIPKSNRLFIRSFLLFSIPYVLMIFCVGILWEIRLYIPLLYGVVILGCFGMVNEEKRVNLNVSQL